MKVGYPMKYDGIFIVLFLLTTFTIVFLANYFPDLLIVLFFVGVILLIICAAYLINHYFFERKE